MAVQLNSIKEVWRNFRHIDQECQQMRDLHLILFKKLGGEKSRTNVGRFKGFQWEDNEEHETTLLYDRLNRFNLEDLRSFCQLFNIKITTRDSWDALAMKLIDFLKFPLENPNEEKAKSQEENDKRFQECSTSSQQYNTKLQTDPKADTDEQVESEKSAELEDLRELRSSHNLLQNKFSTATKPCGDAIEQKEPAMKELDILKNELQQEKEGRERQLLQLQQVTLALKEFEETNRRTVDEGKPLLIKVSALEDTCKSQEKEISILQYGLAFAKQKLEMAGKSSEEISKEFEKQKRYILDLEDNIKVKDAELVEGEGLRRKLHNTIQELKGNIRVFCRVRPMLPDDGPEAKSTVSYPTEGESAGQGICLIQSGETYSFTFDRVFAHDASQQDVFMEISQLVQSALDGYKVCIFAYGQTGSGKTFTMMGRPESPLEKGLIPRSLEQVFETSQALSAQGWRYNMKVSMLEIYNNKIRDLLAPRSHGGDVSRAEVSGAGNKYTIRHDAEGNTCVSDLSVVDVCSSREVLNLLQQAAHSRSVGRTEMNEHSSRSHFVFTLRIYGVNESNEQVHGMLNLIDLAGSERVSKSGAVGERLKETQHINRSLSALSDVISVLSKKEGHVSFRNSTLTFLLEPCLRGDAKTLMFLNVSPDPFSFRESLCSLRFAAKANSCDIGIARRQTKRVKL